MTVIDIRNGALSARISTNGGTVLGLSWDNRDETVELLRPAPADDAGPLSSGCFPLVPFGNRIRDNRFRFDGRDHVLQPNVGFDPLYLHGDGWLGEWTVIDESGSHVELAFSHRQGDTPYDYEARQVVTLDDDAVTMRMSVRNLGETALPFGIGWHPYFSLNAQTTLKAPARRMWTEAEGWLPGEPIDIPTELDFSEARTVPRRWVNNGFEGWNGEAEITWPERHTRLRITADPLVGHAVLFVSDVAYDPTYRGDFFCFEPMSHLSNGHNLPELGDLVPLEKGALLQATMRLQPEAIA